MGRNKSQDPDDYTDEELADTYKDAIEKDKEL